MLVWILRGLAALLALAVIAGLGAAGWLAQRFHASTPVLEGEIALAGAPGSATIVRETNGVAHVFGDSDAAAYFALGHLHASERFFQMDLTRRYVRGRLAALFGPDYVRVDARTRTYGFGAITPNLAAAMSADTRAAVEAYVAGVNARLAQGAVAPEYALLRAAPEPWTIEDSAAVMLGFADDLAAGEREDIERALLADVLDPARLAAFLSPYPDWAPTTLKAEDVRTAFGAVQEESLPPAAAQPGVQPDNLPGSNAWVVAGRRSETGRPLLANDPHLGLRSPSVWYFARLDLSHGPVVGATAPGTPFIVLGRNAHGAWGFTNTGFDVIDLVERDPAGFAITERVERIAVRGRRDPVEIIVRETAEGPILDPAWFDLSAFDPDQLVVRRSTLDDPGNRGADAVHAIMRAESWDAFVEAGRFWTVPMQNMHYAGVDGTIGYTTAGLLPIRDPQTGDWTGFVPFEQLPRVSNPRGGMIVSGNNLVAGRDYPFPLPGAYSVYRAPRIETLLEERERHSLDSFAAIQMDVVSEHARRLLPALLGSEPETQLGAEALGRLETWDGSLDADGPEALILSAWLRVLSGEVWSDELGAVAPRFVQPRRAFLESVLSGENARWCDDVRSEAQVETCAVAAGLALDAAMAETARALGDDISAWRWGDVHVAVFEHPLADLPLIGPMFENRIEVAGDGSTVNLAHFSYGSDGYDANHAASLRAIYDLADLDRSLFMHAPGQSGHPLSPHHDDLAELWARGEFFEIRTDWTAEAPPEGAHMLTLVPAAP